MQELTNTQSQLLDHQFRSFFSQDKSGDYWNFKQLFFTPDRHNRSLIEEIILVFLNKNSNIALTFIKEKDGMVIRIVLRNTEHTKASSDEMIQNFIKSVETNGYLATISDAICVGTLIEYKQKLISDLNLAE